MSTPEPTSGVPVWARKRRKPGNPLVGWVLVPLALFGAATAGLAVRDKSFAGAGTRMDGWVAMARDRVQQVLHPVKGQAKRAAPAKAAAAPAAAAAAPASPTAPPPAAATPTVTSGGGKSG
ncbi:MAG: hypothetical protein KKC14_18360 [Alphaproteobacteria bacterium]|nr:hypothetical protein [Alphaproteobacteria bacterium]